MIEIGRDPILDRDRDLLCRVLDRGVGKLITRRSFPLDLEEILDELGIALTAEPGEPLGNAHGYLCDEDSRWQIVVNASTSAARQRFTVAHEVGHYLVEAQVGFRPTTRAAYWMLEDVCQRFAAELLSPAAVVLPLLAEAGTSPDGLLDVIPALIARTELSLEAAARRVIEAAGSPAAIVALGLRQDGFAGTRSKGATVRWSHVTTPWTRVGRGRRLHPRHVLWPAVAVGEGLPLGGRAWTMINPQTEVLVERRTPSMLLAAIGVDRGARTASGRSPG